MSIKFVNYHRGRNFEYRIINEKKSQGATAFRSAGSHSPIDVVAIFHNRIELIQAKAKNLRPKEISDIEKELTEANLFSSDNVKIYIAYKKRNGRKTIIAYHEVKK